MFDSVVLSTGGPDFYKKAMNDLDDASLKSPTMKKAFDNLAKLKTYVDPNFSGRDWNLATAMVIKGDALVQVMGDWAKGEFNAANKKPGTDYLCYRFPGTDGSVVYNSDMFGMFDVPADRKAAQVQLATDTMSKSFQSAFNVVKGSVPARTDVADTAFDACGKKGIADLKAATEKGTLFGSLAQGYGAPPAVANAYKDVVTKFVHGEIKTSDEAVSRTRQGDRRREVSLERSHLLATRMRAPVRLFRPKRDPVWPEDRRRGDVVASHRRSDPHAGPLEDDLALAPGQLRAQARSRAQLHRGRGVRLRLHPVDDLSVVHQFEGVPIVRADRRARL